MKALNIKQVAEKLSLGQSTIYRMISKGEFPRPFSLGGNRTAWLEEDVDRWLAAKAGKTPSASTSYSSA
ncbi:AlpA family phage regulatory protein [Herbaspirillum sp. RU 5E]|nr:AlpA family phage regulatory protein [Herbaspirillum sp. RU 5E]